MKFNLSEIQKIIEERRTIKPENYTTRKVHKEIVEKMLNAAKWAPTHGMTQPWKFHVFMEEGIKKLAEFQSDLYKEITPPSKFNAQKHKKMKERPLLASAIIAICMKRQESGKIPEVEEVEAVACAVQNMSLLATAYGLGTYWGSGGVTYSNQMRGFLQLGEKDKCLGFLYVGYPSIDWPKGQRKPIEYFTTWRLN